MTSEKILDALVGQMTGLDMSRLADTEIDHCARDRCQLAQSQLVNTAIFICDTRSPTISEIRAKCLEMLSRDRLDLVVILDINTVAEPRNRPIAYVLKNLAQEVDAPILVGATLDRAAETRSRKPRLADLPRKSKLDEVSDTVLLIHREAVLDPDSDMKFAVDINVANNPNGSTGAALLYYDGIRFADLELCREPPVDDSMDFGRSAADE